MKMVVPQLFGIEYMYKIKIWLDQDLKLKHPMLKHHISWKFQSGCGAKIMYLRYKALIETRKWACYLIQLSSQLKILPRINLKVSLLKLLLQRRHLRKSQFRKVKLKHSKKFFRQFNILMLRAVVVENHRRHHRNHSRLRLHHLLRKLIMLRWNLTR